MEILQTKNFISGDEGCEMKEREREGVSHSIIVYQRYKTSYERRKARTLVNLAMKNSVVNK